MIGLLKLHNYNIRFKRCGHIHYNVYEIVLTKRTAASSGIIIEKLGYYNPNVTERLFYVNVPRLMYWVNKGVTINVSVKRYLLNLVHNNCGF